jgi:AraC-like DNA-binding protein
MYSTRIIDTADPDQFIASGRPITDLTVIERGQFKVRSVRMNLQHVWAQRVHERLASLKRIEPIRNVFVFHAEPGPSMFMDGAEIEMNQVAIINAGDCYNWRLAGDTHWGGISFTNEGMDTLFGLKPVRGARVFTLPHMALARLRSVHERIGRLVETFPELRTHTDLAYDLEHALISAVQDIRITQAPSPGRYTGRHHHTLIVARFRRVLEAQGDRPLHMLEVSERIGVSGRILRLACQEQLGMSPFQYVMLRRMQAVRRVLQKADPKVTHVTDVATEHGFWELGRFAVKYRQFFGEMPSVTLKSAA